VLSGSAGEDMGFAGDLDTYDAMTIEGAGPAQSLIVSPGDRAIDAFGPLSLAGLPLGQSRNWIR